MADNFGSAIVELRADTSKLTADMNKVRADITSKAKQIEDTFKNAKLQFDTDLPKMKLQELQTLAVKLRQQFESKRIDPNINLESLQQTKSKLDQVENAVKTFRGEAEKPVNIPAADQLSKWGMIATGINSVIMTVRQFGSDMKRLVGDSIFKAAGFEEMSSYLKASAEQMELFRKVTKGTVGDPGLVALSNRAGDINVKLNDQAILFALAKRAAEAYGGSISVAEGMEKAIMVTEGITRGISKLGLESKVYTKLVDEMAKAHGGNIMSLDGELQKEIRTQALLQLGKPIYDQMIASEKSAADEIESMGVAYEKAQRDLGSFILEGLKPLIKTYDESDKGVKAFISSTVAIGGVIVGALPLLVQLITAKKMYAASTLMASAVLDKEAASATTANIASKGFLAIFGIWGLAAAAAGVVVYSLAENMHTLGTETKTTDDKLKSTIATLEKLGGKVPMMQTYKGGFNLQGFIDLLDKKKNPDWSSIGKDADEVGKHIKMLTFELEKLDPSTKKYIDKFKEIEKLKLLLDPTKSAKNQESAVEKERSKIDAELKAKSEGITANQKLDLQVLLNLESYLSQLGNEYDKKRGIINQAYQKELSDATIQRDQLIRDANNLLVTSKGDKHVAGTVLADKKKANDEYNSTVLEAEKKFNISTIALTDEMNKEKLAYDQKYLALTQGLEKDKYDQAIRDYSLSVKDFEAYLNKMLDLKIQKIEEENKLIEKNNKEHPDNVKSLIDITEQRTIGTTEIKNQTQDYSTNKTNRWDENSTIIDKTTGQLRLMTKEELKTQRGMEQLASTISSGLVQGVVEGEGFINVLGNMILKIGETVAEASILAGIMSLLNPSSPLGFIGFLGKALGMSTGGSFIVPGTGTQDNFPIMVAPGERVNVTPANMVNSYSNSSVDMSGVIKSVNILNANTINMANMMTRQKQMNIKLESRLDGNDILLTNRRAGRIYDRSH
jgi:hypothetical protein